MQRRLLLTAALLVAAAVLPAHAQGHHPTKPIRSIVSFPPSGGIDFTARVIPPALEATLA